MPNPLLRAKALALILLAATACRRAAPPAPTGTTNPSDPAPPGMVLIPAGSFEMGDRFAEGEADERPVHSVYVSAFYIDKYEVTWEKWQEVRAWAATNGYDIGSVGAGKVSNHPVHSVNWYDCVKWCNARSEMEGKPACYTYGGATYKAGEHNDIVCDWNAIGYRLPTEAEWEKAARGGLSGKRFPWGGSINHGNANYRVDRSFITRRIRSSDKYHPDYDDDPMPYTSPVGSFAANGYGLYDMAGNVYEWCWDRYGSSYYTSSPGTDPRGPSTSTDWYRVRRGGGWFINTSYCRVASRYGGIPEYRYDYYGLRAVLPPGQQ